MKQPTPRSIGWSLKVYRTRPKVDLSQVVLAEKTNIKLQRIANIESGRVEPTDGEIKAIAKVLKVKPSTMLALAQSGEPIQGGGQ